jgi:hypothetical protein
VNEEWIEKQGKAWDEIDKERREWEEGMMNIPFPLFLMIEMRN